MISLKDKWIQITTNEKRLNCYAGISINLDSISIMDCLKLLYWKIKSLL